MYSHLFFNALQKQYNRNEIRIIMRALDEVFHLSEVSEFQIIEWIHRLQKGEPYQYLTQEAEFMGLKFKVNPYTLIPRPETEELVSWVFENLNGSEKFLDIGTGSGVIAISIKKKFKESEVTAIDIDEKAIEVARENAVFHQQNIHFKVTDFLLFQNDYFDEYDSIVSNPPYIPLHELDSINANVKNYEPHTALFVPKENPILFYEKIAQFSQHHLKQKGKIWVEIHQKYSKEVESMFKEHFDTVVVKDDISGNPRLLMAYGKK